MNILFSVWPCSFREEDVNIWSQWRTDTKLMEIARMVLWTRWKKKGKCRIKIHLAILFWKQALTVFSKSLREANTGNIIFFLQLTVLIWWQIDWIYKTTINYCFLTKCILVEDQLSPTCMLLVSIHKFSGHFLQTTIINGDKADSKILSWLIQKKSGKTPLETIPLYINLAGVT